MQLYFMQHGYALPKKVDIEEGLSKEGINLIKGSAEGLKKLNLTFDLVISSNKKRAKMSAEIIVDKLNINKNHFITTDMFNPKINIEKTVSFIRNYVGKEKICIIGHLPSLLEIISFFISTSFVKINISNGNIIRIDTDLIENNSGILMWALNAAQLKEFK